MSDSWRPTATVDTLLKRSELLDKTRTFFRERGIVEVQTSTLDRYPVTDVAIENIEVANHGFLQSSPEFQMKRLLAAGMPSCYQLGQVFRDGERGRWHNTEFTMLEWYELDVSLESLMANVAALTDVLLGSQEYLTITVKDLLQESVDVNPHDGDGAHWLGVARSTGLANPRDGNDALDYLIAAALKQLRNQRVFLTEYPVSQAALAATEKRDGVEVALRFELIVDGIEIANGYDELQDVNEFRRRCAHDNERRAALGLPIRSIDPEFEAAMEHGLPACCGVAVGLDRLFALAIGVDTLQEAMAFATPGK